ncbi:MAG TPA: alkaline phosphatase family protein [Paludibacter sp.]|nr:alkaline phosphatase family protein [Paludibacter sp.]
MRNKLHIFLVFTILHFFGIVSAQINRPRLVIGIMVDGLKQKHIDELWNTFDDNGFKRLIKDGANFRNMQYNIVSAGNASDVANVMTGSIPFYNGITGNLNFDRKTGNVQSILQDENQIGIGTLQTLSAHNLQSSTVADELKLAYPEKSKTYAIAIHPENAIMLGGHTANGVSWIDDINLKWITTGYFTEGLSRSADEMNVNGEFKNIASRKWEPMYPLRSYWSSKMLGTKATDFNYNPTDKRTKRSLETLLNTSPSANTLIAELGLKILTNENLGADNYPDMLMLQFTVRTPKEKLNSLISTEKEDMYIRLDREIQNLMYKVNQKLGIENVLYFMFSNQTDAYSPIELGENKIPAGYFSANRSMALLNSYLMALYGQEKWVDSYFGKNIYLNKSKIEERKLNFREVQRVVCDFMLDFEGVQAAYIPSDLITMGGNDNSEKVRIRNSIHKNNVGDVIVSLMPGWLELDEKYGFIGESGAVMTHMPFYMYGCKIKPQVVDKSYLTIDIAPTLSRILNIPFPNASIGKVMEEIVNQ